jgi:hypothetical protein
VRGTVVQLKCKAFDLKMCGLAAVKGRTLGLVVGFVEGGQQYWEQLGHIVRGTVVQLKCKATNL